MATKQEQQDARTGVTEVAPNVLRMELPIRMPGLGHVNCYALIDDEGAAVVDPGLPGPDTQQALKHRLAQASLRETDVHTVIITHSHPDHFGCANWLAKSGGARIVAYESFGSQLLVPSSHAHEVSVDDVRAQQDARAHSSESESDAESATPSLTQHWSQRLGRSTPWGGSAIGPTSFEGQQGRVAELVSSEDAFPDVSHHVRHGDVLRLARREWFVHFTPGHTSDHFCLHSPELDVFLSGDHVLPSITPHISGLGTEEDPLKLYVEALDRVAEIEHVNQVLPAHGDPFDNLSERTEAIKRHHEERLGRVKQIGVELGPASVVAFSQRLFPERSWGSMAESETYAHLEHLRHSREAECHSEDGVLIYVIR